MSSDVQQLRLALQAQPVVLVRVHSAKGSVPRSTGTWMAVCGDTIIATIGGGHLEWQAIAHAKALAARALAAQAPAVPVVDEVMHFKLGPSLGQCCGGALDLRFEYLAPGAHDGLLRSLQPSYQTVALFGGGHVGHAIERALRPLPFDLMWIDSRDQVFPTQVGEGVVLEHSNPVQAAVADVPANALVLIMSFSHAEDLDVVVQCLGRQRVQADLPFVGLIGSKTKWATFQNRLRERGFGEAEIAHVTCPIGVSDVVGKEPAVIAAAVVAQLLQHRVE
ncbi:xanthine dehydrogenase accessory protein XdhC [Comamonadaceae bacterium M7527]|nr:xanthine dehydrogenase accessory protein XdhC [Comamonadaceae bacterium M7527]